MPLSLLLVSLLLFSVLINDASSNDDNSNDASSADDGDAVEENDDEGQMWIRWPDYFDGLFLDDIKNIYIMFYFLFFILDTQH